MAWTIADGPAGLEGIHTWDGAAILNDRSGGLPYVKLEEISGLYGLPEADDLRDPRTGRQGEATRPGFPRGKGAVYTGTIYATDPRELRAYSGELRAAFAERAFEHPMRIAPPAFAGGGPIWLYSARALGCDIPERQDVGLGAMPTPWQRPITITLRLSDGRFVVDAAAVDSGAFADGATEAISQSGTADADPVFTGTIASGSDLLLENHSVPIASGGHAFLQFLSVPAAGTVTVDFASRAAYIVDGSSVTWDLMPVLDSSSNWWDEQVPGLLPGSNSIQATGLASWHIARPVRSW